MNRLEMAAQISDRMPLLEIDYKEKLRGAEKLRRQFVTDYPVARIHSLRLDEFVIGKGGANPSFCYRLERGLDELGRILGATAFKFGVYYGRTKSDPREEYRFQKGWGANVETAFSSVKSSIVNLLQAGSKSDLRAIRENRISPMFKGKLLFIYNPEMYAPVYARPHLEHFLAQLNISGEFQSEAEMQRALMDYRATWPELRRHHPCLYMQLLYGALGRPSRKTSAGNVPLEYLPLLSKAIKGASFIDTMPPVKNATSGVTGTGSGSKINREKQDKRHRIIGDRGEAIVLELEKRRLAAAKRSDLSKRIRHVSQKDDSVGFDILSFDADGTQRPIEVKATSGENLERGFYISANEVDRASKLANYYIYFVFSAKSIHPRVFQVKQPFGSEWMFELETIAYHATLKKRGIKS